LGASTGWCIIDRASLIFARIDVVVDTERYLLDVHSGAGRVPMACPFVRGSDS
jgi:hypothetical protein